MHSITMISPNNKCQRAINPPNTYGTMYHQNRLDRIIGKVLVMKNVAANMLCVAGAKSTEKAVSNNKLIAGMNH